ncbi:hypothetical protein [Thermomonospora amylolytica]|uniref:hypothetical protein n=1 Tax=Thermomonospora amylolytica TaxID=1411117 RepID=UPI001300B1F6|nr:hypothetical protein [Thermomonospora amylolytica]
MDSAVNRQALPVEAFRTRLRDHHLACGAPPYRSVVEVARRLPELYPDALKDRTLPRLSVATISAILTGQRVGLPDPEWVAAFVLACQRRAFETCVLVSDPGPEVLPRWMDWYRQAQAEMRSVGMREHFTHPLADDSQHL